MSNKQNRDRLIDGKQDASEWERIEGRGIEHKGKRTHGHRQQCGNCLGEEGVRELNGNGKNIIKVIYLKK